MARKYKARGNNPRRSGGVRVDSVAIDRNAAWRTRAATRFRKTLPVHVLCPSQAFPARVRCPIIPFPKYQPIFVFYHFAKARTHRICTRVHPSLNPRHPCEFPLILCNPHTLTLGTRSPQHRSI